MTTLIVLCVVLATLLICVVLAAFDMITGLDEDVEAAEADRDDYKGRLEAMSARCVQLQAENTDLAFALDAVLDPTDEKPARHLKAIPSMPTADVVDLFGAFGAARNLSDDRIHTWLTSWETPEGGDLA